MDARMYIKLAITNIKNNAKMYIPYMVASTGFVMMFYIITSISFNPAISSIRGAEVLKAILAFAMIIVGILSAIILFYTNSFLIKRRKMEFGLYNILGMEKRHIGRVISVETLLMSAICIIGGIILGIVLDKLAFMFLLKIITFDVPLGFNISKRAITNTLIVFTVTFFITLLNNLRHIHLNNPIDLLKGGTVGEREPKVKWFFAIVGIVTLSLGYYIALKPTLITASVNNYFNAVILVIIGTYGLFTAGSIVILKILKRKKSFYYRRSNFITISGMIYRMKQNAVGLASICILSTMVIVTVASTAYCYFNIQGIVEEECVRDMTLIEYSWDENSVNQIESAIDDKLKSYGMEKENVMEFRSIAHPGALHGKDLEFGDSTLIDESGVSVTFLPLEDFNNVEGSSYQLSSDEVMIYSEKPNYSYNYISILGRDYKVKKVGDESEVQRTSNVSIVDSYFIIVKDFNMVKEMGEKIDQLNGDLYPVNGMNFYGFDIKDGDAQKILDFQTEIEEKFSRIYITSSVETINMYYGVFGGFLFIGVFLGIIFLMATVLIIYYKQVSEGYDDRHRFEIMQKVGMSKSEVMATIHKQILMVFAIPLVAAIIHVCFASKLTLQLISISGISNPRVFAISNILVVAIFALIYIIVYLLTAKTYYRIVNQKYEY